jgi:hypothetical protein
MAPVRSVEMHPVNKLPFGAVVSRDGGFFMVVGSGPDWDDALVIDLSGDDDDGYMLGDAYIYEVME